MVMVEVHVERTIGAPPERVFDWLADPAGLKAAPAVLRSVYLKSAPGPGKGAVRQVIAAGAWFREEFTAYDPPRSYSYLIVSSFPPLIHEGGTLTFTPRDGGTHVDWVSRYTHPRWVGGKHLEPVTHRLLCASFDSVLAGCAKALER
jgi:uncharacterized protein YndB with AHSA1/START domain